MQENVCVTFAIVYSVYGGTFSIYVLWFVYIAMFIQAIHQGCIV